MAEIYLNLYQTHLREVFSETAPFYDRLKEYVHTIDPNIVVPRLFAIVDFAKVDQLKTPTWAIDKSLLADQRFVVCAWLRKNWDENYAIENNSNQVADGTTPIQNNSNQVADSATPVQNNSNQVADGTTPIQNNSNQVADSATPIQNNSNQVADGTTPIQNNSNQVADGTTPSQNNSNQVADGTTPSQNNSNQVADSATPVQNNSNQVADGTAPNQNSVDSDEPMREDEEKEGDLLSPIFPLNLSVMPDSYIEGFSANILKSWMTFVKLHSAELTPYLEHPRCNAIFSMFIRAVYPEDWSALTKGEASDNDFP